MNICVMAAPFGAYMDPYALFHDTGANRAAYIFTSVVFDLKMMGLFSTLFGAGVLLVCGQADRMREAPARALVQTDVLAPGHRPRPRLPDMGRRHSRAGRALRPAPPVVGATASCLGPGRGSGHVLAVGALLTIGHGSAWTAMPEAERAKELELWMPTREQGGEQLARMLGTYGQVVAHRAPFGFMA